MTVTSSIFIYITDMPPKVRETVVPCGCDYTVYINSRLSKKGQEEAYLHALWHIEHNDFESEEDVQIIEARAHRREE